MARAFRALIVLVLHNTILGENWDCSILDSSLSCGAWSLKVGLVELRSPTLLVAPLF